ncbi:MAG: DUF421 domain-containing protein [Bacteroidota bacterium]
MARAWAEVYAYLVRPVAIYLAALSLVRLMGKRALGQLSLFDLVVMAGIGDIIVVVGLERKVPIVDGLVVLGILAGLEILLSLMTFRWRWFARLIEGQPTILVRDGRLEKGNMLREHISLRDLRQELRKQGIDDPHQAKEVVLEACGKVSVIPREETPADTERILAELSALRRDLTELRAKLDEPRHT